MEPNTLQQAILYFASPDNCREYWLRTAGRMALPVRVAEQEGSISSEV